jgi:hypothetical protein
VLQVLEISTALAGILVRNGTALAKEPVRRFLADRTLRRRVARKTTSMAKTADIAISKKHVRRWLGTGLAADQLQAGTSEALGAAVEALRDTGKDRSLTREEAGRVLVIVLDQFLRQSQISDAVATSTGWVARSVENTEARLGAQIGDLPERIRGVLGASDDSVDDLARLRPWRQEKGRQVLREHRPAASLLRALVAEEDRGAVLTQWAENPPADLDQAPAVVWIWLGELACDYGANEAAVTFFRCGVSAGAYPRAYWLARATRALSGSADTQMVTELLDDGADQHPLGRAIRAEMAGDPDTMVMALDSWQPEDQTSGSIRAISSARILADKDQLNAAIAVLMVFSQDRQASGAALELARLLLHRSRTGRSDHAIADANQGLALAVQVRNARRYWGGDTTDAVVLAVTAAALLGDMERAWRLTQVEDGEATPKEAQSVQVRREAAILASLTQRHDVARELAADLDDPYVAAMNEAFEAMRRDDIEGANAAWTRAFDNAGDDAARLTTAMLLGEAGAALPDLTELGERHPAQVREIKVVHEVMSTSDDRFAVLRARVHESPRLALALATHYDSNGHPDKAAEVLVEAGDRHREALLVRMGADRYMRARMFPEAQAAAENALALGGADWPGEFDARAVLFDSMMGQGNTAGAFAQAQALVALSPDDPSARWALAYAHMRRGDGEAAWRALSPEGAPIDPRNPEEARLWVELASDHDRGPRFVPRVLRVISHWPDDEGLQGAVLARMFFALRDRDDPEDGVALRAAADAFVERWPESRMFRSVQLGPEDDPFAPLAQELADQANALEPIFERVKGGDLPLGILTVTGRTYAEAVVRRAAGMVRSFDPTRTDQAADAITTARAKNVVIDTTAMGTLVSLDESLRHRLIGTLARVETSESAYHDALGAQAALGMRSTMTVGWDSQAGQPRVYETTAEDAELLATRSAAIAELVATLPRRTRTGPSRFNHQEGQPDWLEAYEIAHSDNLVFWCDDTVLAGMARSEGVATFSTVALLRTVLTTGPADSALLEVAEGTLIANYHVDLGFNVASMQFAAELDNWKARGAAFALSRGHTWDDAEAAGEFLLSALDRHGSAATGNLEDLREWTVAGTLGAVRAAPDEQLAMNNAGIVLATVMARPWLGADQLAQVVRGVRAAVAERPETGDPLEAVLREFYARLVKQTGHGIASKAFMSLVRQLPEADRHLAARIVLDSD